MAEDAGIPVGWVLTSVAATIAALAAAVRWLAASKDKQYGDRIAALEAAVVRSDLKVDELNAHIRDKVTELLVESHAREKRLAAIIARFGDPEPVDLPGPGTEAVERPRAYTPRPVPGALR